MSLTQLFIYINTSFSNEWHSSQKLKVDPVQPEFVNRISMAESVSYVKAEFLLFSVFGALSMILNTVEIILTCRKRKTLKSYEQLLLTLSAGEFITGFTFSRLGALYFSGVELAANRDKISAGLLMVFSFSVDNLSTWMTGSKMKFIIITVYGQSDCLPQLHGFGFYMISQSY